jgi:hypothetical protein
MKRGLKLSNSIYSGSQYDGLTVRNGRLINNRPDGQTGIAQASEIRKSMKRAEKISIVAKGTAMGEMMSEMGEECGCD